MSTTQLARPVPAKSTNQDWYAVYTRHSHERTVRDAFASREIESYLPTYSVRRRRANRCVVELTLPLFPTYIFARIDWAEHARLLEVPGVVSIVGFGSQRSMIPGAEIEALRSALTLVHAAPYPYLNIGERVRIRSGPLEGLTAIVLRTGNNLRVVLSVQLIMKSVVVDVEQWNLEPVGWQS